jgi:heptosyltransferase-2
MTIRSRPLPQTLYVRGLNWIGDAVLSLGALQGLRKVRPDLTIVVGAPEATADVYRMSEAVDSVIPPPSIGREGFHRFDAALILPLSFRSAFESFPLSRRRIGFAGEGRSILLTRALSYQSWKSVHAHQSTYYETLFQEIDPRVSFDPPVLRFSDAEIADARTRLEESPGSGPRIAINPGAYYGRAKTWPIPHFEGLIRRLFDYDPDLTVVLFSGQADRPLAEEIKKRVADSRVISFAGRLALKESAATLSLCDYLVTNDSGMMHLGGATGRRGVALFGPTDPVATGPLRPKAGAGLSVLSYQVSCQPCLLRECPIDHRCMEGLLPELVYARIIQDLDRLII